MAKKKRVLSERQKYINKINARIRAQVKAGVTREAIDDILADINGVTLTHGGITIKDEDFDEDLKLVLDEKIKTVTELIKHISSDEETYNVVSDKPTKKELINAYNSRSYMNSVMDDQFKKYYDLVVNNSIENVKTSPELSQLKDSMGDFARALQRGDLDEAHSIYDDWLNPLLQGKTLEELGGDV